MTDGTDRKWRILLVEDEEEVARATVGALERRPVTTSGEYAEVEHVANFDEGIGRIEDRRYDLIILDIRDQEAAAHEPALGTAAVSGDETIPADKGLELYEEIRRRRFLPIVFYSAVANLAQDKNDPPFVTVVSKLDNEDNLLRQKITDVFDSRLPLINRALVKHVDNIFRDFMIGFVEERWAELSGSQYSGDLAYLVVRQLARSLDPTFVAELAGTNAPRSSETVHPTRMYIMPRPADPCTGDTIASTGDVIQGSSGRWYIILTPTCDLVSHDGKRKAEYIVAASCLPLTEADEYKAWLASGQPDSHGKLDRLIANNRPGQRDRYYFLPATWGMPDLMVDLQQISYFPYTELGGYTHVATLDDPYAQSLIAQLGRFNGRVGTPDLDAIAVKERLRRAEIAEPSGVSSTIPQGSTAPDVP
jgi:CheY-like chemotaxis protein